MMVHRRMLALAGDLRGPVAAGCRGGLAGDGVTTLLILLVLTGECFRPFGELTAFWHAGFLGTSASAGIAALLAAEPGAPDRPGAPALPTDAPPTVTFTYPGRSTPAVHDLSFEVRAGETVAVVGRSGAGKTTLVNLLLRFVAPQAGRVTAGGHDVAAVNAESLREHVAVVSQDTYLFCGTVADNLRLAKAGDIRGDVFDGLERLAPGWLLGRRTGDLAAAAITDVESPGVVLRPCRGPVHGHHMHSGELAAIDGPYCQLLASQVDVIGGSAATT